MFQESVSLNRFDFARFFPSHAFPSTGSYTFSGICNLSFSMTVHGNEWINENLERVVNVPWMCKSPVSNIEWEAWDYFYLFYPDGHWMRWGRNPQPLTPCVLNRTQCRGSKAVYNIIIGDELKAWTYLNNILPELHTQETYSPVWLFPASGQYVKYIGLQGWINMGCKKSQFNCIA